MLFWLFKQKDIGISLGKTLDYKVNKSTKLYSPIPRILVGYRQLSFIKRKRKEQRKKCDVKKV